MCFAHTCRTNSYPSYLPLIMIESVSCKLLLLLLFFQHLTENLITRKFSVCFIFIDTQATECMIPSRLILEKIWNLSTELWKVALVKYRAAQIGYRRFKHLSKILYRVEWLSRKDLMYY